METSASDGMPGGAEPAEDVPEDEVWFAAANAEITEKRVASGSRRIAAITFQKKQEDR